MIEPFNYNKTHFGGTEYMGRGWHKHISQHVPKFKDYLSLIIPGVAPTMEALSSPGEEIILWMHNTPQQFSEDANSLFKNKTFLSRIKAIIVVSEEQKRLTLLEINVDPNIIYIIPNAIKPLVYNPDKFKNVDKVKLIHTSSADRGMDVMLNSLRFTDMDFRLEVYNNFNPDEFEEEFPDKRVKFYNRTPRATVREAYENSHIHVYPSIYPETFCISQVEAMSAGLLCLTSDLGALPEVSKGHTQMYSYINDREEHQKVFVKELEKAIEKIKSGSFDPTAQIEYVNKTYSWEAIKQKWIEFHDLI
jgi:phosphatidylinositol glycan class A protein